MNIQFLKAILLATLLSFSFVIEAALPDSIPRVKNIILMIPDGCSLASYSFARWYQRYLSEEKKYLAIDPFLTGTVLTYCSDSPVGDSAPTTSCYVTGYPSKAGFIATYPPSKGEADIIPINPKQAYRPLATLLEYGKIELNKKTGLVVTCEFPHATPADCSAHSANRKNYHEIVPQILHQNIDIVFAGGSGLLPLNEKQILEEKGYDVCINNLDSLRKSKKNKVWALFGRKAPAYDFDRDPLKEPSLSEMVKIALDKLSKDNTNGFFLLVEGSKVDWAAHKNDPVGIVSEVLAFDKACKEALDFAQKHKDTAVIILSDHGNSGISIAKEDGYSNAQNMDKDQFFLAFSKHKKTAEGLCQALQRTPYHLLDSITTDLCALVLDTLEREALVNCLDYKQSPIQTQKRKINKNNPFSSKSTEDFCCRLLTKHSPIAFTTHGHTGEDVILFAYHPQDAVPRGMTINVDLAKYLAALWGAKAPFDELSQEIFSPASEVFKGLNIKKIDPKKDVKNLRKFYYENENLSDYAPTLIIQKGRKKMSIPAYADFVIFNGKKIPLKSVVVYQANTDEFYLPRILKNYFN